MVRIFNDLPLPITLNCIDVLKCVSLVAQMCLTLYDYMDCRLPASSVHFSGKNTGAGCCFLLQGIFPIQGSKPRPLCLYHCALGSLRSILSISQFSHSGVSDSLQPHGLQHARLPCPSPNPRACSNSCPSSRWYHPTILSSVIPFSSHLQSFPASGSFPMSQFFASGGQSIGVSASASVLPVNTQDWSPLGWTGWISL